MYNTMENELLYALMQEEQEKQNRRNQLTNLSNNLGNLGQNLNNAGEILGSIDNSVSKTLAGKLNTAGNSLQSLSTKTNPASYFKGFAKKPFANVGTSAISNSISSVAPSAVTTAGSALGAGTAGTAGASTAGATAFNPAGLIGTLAVMAVQGANRKRAKSSGQQLMNATNQDVQQSADEALANTQLFANNMQKISDNSLGQYGLGNIDLYNRPQVKNEDGSISTVRSMSFNDGNNEVLIPTVSDSGEILTPEQAIENYKKTGKYLGKFNSIDDANNYANRLHNEQDKYYNGITGGASSIQNNDAISAYQDYLRGAGYSDNVINGVAQGLNGGNKEIADWINQYNQGAEGKANPINIPKTPEEIALAQQGQFNKQPLKMNAEATKNQKLIDKLANGLADMQKGYQENRTTAFDPSNLYSNDNKSKMTRAGEFFGTVGRLAQNPAVQGLIAGGVSTALTGNPLYGAGMFYKFANNRQMNNIYQQVLKDRGLDTNVGTYGNIDANTFNTLLTPQYKDAINEYNMMRLKELEYYHEMLTKLRKEKIDSDNAYREKDLKIKQQNADSNRIRAMKAGSRGSSSTKAKKPQDNPDWNKDLADFRKRVTDPRYINQVDNMTSLFVNKYGVDPMKYIKL